MTADPGFGVYIHWPFCQAKCPYCDFNSHVSANVDTNRWERALVGEIRRQSNLADAQPVTSVFFGGGTPSLMPPSVVGACLDAIAEAMKVAPDCEVTLEANPTSSDATKFAGFKAAGVGRLSMGVQALNDADLKRLGRLHSAAEAIEAFDNARKMFDRVSFDLIYARQDQSLKSWLDELDTALAMAIDHLSLYQLTIEPGTRFGDMFDRGRLRGLPKDNVAAQMYEETAARCEAAGLGLYEVSNASRDGAECRHNLTYWRYGAYLGIGPGAHGRRDEGGTRYATESLRAPGAWLAAVEKNDGAESTRALQPEEMSDEYALMALRLREGLNLERLARFGGSINAEAAARLVTDGFLRKNGDRLLATTAGRMVLNTILSEILT